MKGARICKPKLSEHCFQKTDALAQAVEKRHLQLRAGDRQRNSRKSSAGADIDQARAVGKADILKQQQTVEKMLFAGLLRRSDRCQIHARVPVHEHLIITGKLCALRFVKRETRRQQLVDQSTDLAHCAALRVCSSQTKSAVISAGLTPEMRLACPTVSGRTASSF